LTVTSRTAAPTLSSAVLRRVRLSFIVFGSA
jgi:hypothetical protein